MRNPRTEPARTEPARTEPARTEPARTDLRAGAAAKPAKAAGPRPIETIGQGRPPIVDVLGNDGVLRVTGVKREGGRIVWFNWALAESLGLELPRDRKMTPELEKKLLAQLDVEVLPKGADPAGKETVELYADYYGGEGLGYNRGSGRAAFFGDLNLNAKGIGAIEGMLDPKTSFDHRHGAMSLVEGGLESVLGEVNTNLFSRGSTRILAVLDRGDYLVWENGGVERRGVAFRAGKQTRPAHLLAAGKGGTAYDKLLRMLDASGDLVRAKDGKVDLSGSLRRLIDAHARTAAEQFRHRILHGALSPSNTEHDGAMLDLATETSQPRTAPVRVLERGGRNELYSFEGERLRRVDHLQAFYDLAEDTITRKNRGLAKTTTFKPFSVKQAFEQAYAREKTRALAEATGLPSGLATEVCTRHAGLAERFARLASSIAAEENRVPDLNVDKQVVHDASVADLFGALGRLPRRFFLEPDLDLPAALREALELRGGDEPKQKVRIEEKIEQLASAYRDLLTSAKKLHVEKGGDPIAFERAVIQKAELENQPLDWLYRANLRWTMLEAVSAYEASGDAEAFQQKIDSVVAHSLRSVDALKTLGESRTLDDGTRIVEERTVRGVTYGVRIPGDRSDPTVDVSVPVVHLEEGLFRLPSLDGAVLDRTQLESLAFRYTLDDWSTHAEVRARLDGDHLVFEVPSFPSQAARMEGLFHVTAGDFWIKDRASNFEGYVFAVPDPWES